MNTFKTKFSISSSLFLLFLLFLVYPCYACNIVFGINQKYKAVAFFITVLLLSTKYRFTKNEIFSNYLIFLLYVPAIYSVLTLNPKTVFMSILMLSSIFMSRAYASWVNPVAYKYALYASIVASALSFIGLILYNYGYFFTITDEPRTGIITFLTFSDTIFDDGRLIRPSFLYDEPGMFSLIIITLCIIYHIYNGPTVLACLALAAGIVTMSKLHFVIALSYISYCVLRSNKFKRFSSVFFISCVILTIYLLNGSASNELVNFFQNPLDAIVLRLGETPKLMRSFDINIDNIFHGQDLNGVEAVGTSLLTNFYVHGLYIGILSLIPVIILIDAMRFSSTRFVSVLFLLVLIVRPHIFQIYTAPIIVMCIYTIYCRVHHLKGQRYDRRQLYS